MASKASAPLQRALMNTTNAAGETIAWEWITDAPAHRFSAYSYTCPTLYDSVSVNSGMHLFLVSAVTSNGNVFYNSDPDSGYSVDNIPPFPPQNISADIVGNGIALTWSPNADADLQQYVVYRSGNPIRDVSGMTPYATATDTVFTDATPLPGVVNYYVLRAQDIHGNLSIASLQVSLVATGVAEEGTLPTQFGLSQNYPNPFNPSTEIRYQVARIRGEGDGVTPSLSRGGQGSRQKDGGQAVVSLRVYDLLGREVATLVNERREPGYYEVRFDGSGLTSGIYYCRMTAGTFVQTRKLVLMR